MPRSASLLPLLHSRGCQTPPRWARIALGEQGRRPFPWQVCTIAPCACVAAVGPSVTSVSNSAALLPPLHPRPCQQPSPLDRDRGRPNLVSLSPSSQWITSAGRPASRETPACVAAVGSPHTSIPSSTVLLPPLHPHPCQQPLSLDRDRGRPDPASLSPSSQWIPSPGWPASREPLAFAAAGESPGGSVPSPLVLLPALHRRHRQQLP